MCRVRNFSIENFENFQGNLLALKKIRNGYYENPDDLYSDFAKMFKSIYEQSFPWKKVNRKRKTWMDSEVKEAREWLLILQRYANDSEEANESFKSFQRKYLTLLQRKKSKHIQKAINNSKNPSKTLWDQVKRNSNFKEKSKNNFILDRNEIPPHEIMNEYNKFSTTIKERVTLIKSNLGPLAVVPRIENTCVLHPTDIYEVETIINELKNKSSVGEDQIPIQIIKKSVKHTREIIARVFNLMIECGQ
nr:PREDICTED: uncharacterized protein LOC109034562 [Bemisia tabaci]